MLYKRLFFSFDSRIILKFSFDVINSSKHLVLEAAHPSPLARGAFFGSKHFSKCNEFLISKDKVPIDWSLNEIDLFSAEKV